MLYVLAMAQLVATISFQDFQLGRAWTWEYREQSGALYSTERYTVVAVNGTEVTLEMSTSFPGHDKFEAHHRLQVSIDRCLAAYPDAYTVKPWSFRMFHRDGGTWTEYDPPSTIAFEEKFNCDPYRHDSRDFLTVFKSSPVGEVFSHFRWRKIPGSWFMNEGSDRGVVYEKEFTHTPGVGETYHMRLVVPTPASPLMN